MAIDKEIFSLAVSSFMRHNPAGCCLHIVLDDGNLEDDDVLFCIMRANKVGHDECLAIGVGLYKLSEPDRQWVYENY